MSDTVNRPSHYTEGRTVEVIDYIREQTGAGFVDYCVGNALKYLSRAGLKGDTAEDYAKAAWYCRMAAHVQDPTRFPDPRGGVK